MTLPRRVPKLGIWLCMQDPPNGARIAERWREALALAEVADAAGLDYVGVPEHHARPDAFLPAPFVALGAFSARTQRIGLATTISVGPLWHPVRLAEEVATLDVLSGGRVTLGLGLGNFAPEMRLYGVDPRRQAPCFDEVIEATRALLHERDVAFAGTFFSFDTVTLTPRSVQPRVPIWLAAMSPPGIARAARYGLPLVLDSLRTMEELEPAVASYREQCAEHGHVGEVVLMRYAWFAEHGDPEALLWPHLRRVFEAYTRDVPRIGATAPLDAFAAFAQDRFLVGPRADVAERAHAWCDRLGADTLLLRFQGTTGPWGPELRAAVEAAGGLLG